MTTTVLGAYAEDIHFPNGTMPTLTDSRCRAGYGRIAIDNRADLARSNSLIGGAVTSCWISAYGFVTAGGGTAKKFIGVGLNGAGNKGVGIGSDTSAGNKLAIWKFDGTTRTQLAAESGTSIPNGSIYKFDLQITGNSGLTSCTLTAYVNGTQVATVSSVDLSALFATLDCYVLGDAGGYCVTSEFIVADGDTRTFSAVTNAPVAAGSANNWNGAYTDISETTNSDATVNYVNTTGQSVQYNVTDLPSGTFAVKAVSIASRMQTSGSNVPTGVKLGLLIGGTEYLDSAHTLSGTPATYERLMTVSPATSAAFSLSEVNAMQLDHQSA